MLQVNTAARMESTGEPCRTQVTEVVHDLLTSHHPHARIVTDLRAEMDVKGKGVMRTYWLMKLESV